MICNPNNHFALLKNKREAVCKMHSLRNNALIQIS